MDKNLNKKIEDISQDVVDLVVARLQAIPSNVQISIGGDQSFDIGELIERVKAKDDIGRKMIEMQLQYLRSLSSLPVEQNAIANN